VWDVEGPVDTLVAYFGGTGHAMFDGAGSNQRSQPWFVIQDQTGDPIAVLSGPMGGTTTSGAVTQPMRIAWRGVLCNTGGVGFADEREWSMPALRIGHKGLHVERLDGLPYIFNRQYLPDRLNCGRTSASEIATRSGGSTTQPTSWTPHSRDASADMLILMRNRAMIASHGRFLQPDPNATGLPVMGDLSFGGSALSPPRPEVELATWTTDGLNVLAYCSGDAVNRGDPTGLFAGLLGPTSMFDLYTDHMVNTLEWGNSARNSINMLVERYAGTQMALMQWLMTPNAPDHWFQMITGINFGSDGAPAADPLEQVRASGDEQALGEQLALRRSMGGNVAGVMKHTLDWMTPGIKVVNKALRHHGSWRHNNAIITASLQMMEKFKTLNPSSIMHNMALRDQAGKVISTIRPDVQAWRQVNGKWYLHVTEVIYTSPPKGNRQRDIQQAVGPSVTVIYNEIVVK
jgi:hypothetical protein